MLAFAFIPGLNLFLSLKTPELKLDAAPTKNQRATQIDKKPNLYHFQSK
jgi:hypothetical protein